MPFRALRSGKSTRAKARAEERLVPPPAFPTGPPRGAWLVRARRWQRRKRRRDPLEQCPDNHGNVRGGVTLGRSGALPREQSRVALQVSRVAANPVARWVPNRSESTSVFRKPSLFAGRRRKGISAVSSQRGGVSSPPKAQTWRPGCSRERSRRGIHPSHGESFARAPSARAGCGGESLRSSRGSPHRAVKCARKRVRGPPRKRRRLGGNVGSALPRERTRKMRPRPPANSRARIGCSKGVPVRRVVLQKSSGVAWPREA
jgi:hypothetical protein